MGMSVLFMAAGQAADSAAVLDRGVPATFRDGAPTGPLIPYIVGQELPPLDVTWLGTDGAVLPLATGAFTFAVEVAGALGGFTKTTGITASDSSPNLVIAWATSAELSALTPGEYALEIRATKASKQRIARGRLLLRGAA